jgi:predicted nucleotidyltransferase
MANLNVDVARKTVKQYLGSEDLDISILEQILDLVTSTGFEYEDPIIKARANWKSKQQRLSAIDKALKSHNVTLDADRMTAFLASQKSA